ncbi:MAG: RDD family protein [Smithellaceae bacterium]|nr:RDD family protein [Smithellaceae bacterium]
MIPSVYGGFWRRAAALLIDKAILMTLSIFFFFLGVLAQLMASDSPQLMGDLFFGRATEMAGGFLFIYYLAVAILGLLYFTYFIGYAAQTPGKMLFGLYVIRTDGKNMNYRQAFLRWIGYLLSGLVFYLGFLWVIFDRKRQGWHDKLADSIVIHIPRDRIIPSPPPVVEEDEAAQRSGIEDYINRIERDGDALEQPETEAFRTKNDELVKSRSHCQPCGEGDGNGDLLPLHQKCLDKEKDIY